MNFKDLKSNFNIRYNTNADVPCFFAGTPLFLLGDVTSSNSSSLLTVLSTGTAVAINTHASKNIFSIQNTSENITYTCAGNELSKYHENNYANPLFNFISKIMPYLPQKLASADMLFLDNTLKSQFTNPIGALCSAIYLLYFPEREIKDFLGYFNYGEPETAAKLTAALVLGKEQCLVHTGHYENYKKYRLPISNKKIIIILTDGKNQFISQGMDNAFNKLQKEHPEITISTELADDIIMNENSLNDKEKDFLCFMLNEENRIKKYPKISNYEEFCNIINESAKEFLKIANSPDLDLLANVLSNNPKCHAFRPVQNLPGIYCIVPNVDVDAFIEKTVSEYEKKAGYKPAFYVCDTASSGIEHGIT